MKKWVSFVLLMLLLTLCGTANAQSNWYRSVMVNSNGLVVIPTNFWVANYSNITDVPFISNIVTVTSNGLYTNITVSSNFLYGVTITKQTGSQILSNALDAGIVTNGSLLLFQPGSVILSNLAVTGALTNSGMFQSGSVILSNALGAGIVTNGSLLLYQPGSTILSNLAVTGALTNSGMFQSGSITLSNALANGIVTNQSIITISNVFDWRNYKIRAAGGGVVIDFDNTALQADGIFTLDWGVGDLIDAAQRQSLNWFTRRLYNTNHDIILDWTGSTIQGNGSSLSNLNWNNISNAPVVQSGSLTLSNALVNGIVTNQSLLNLSNTVNTKQYGSTVLSNIVGTGALTNAAAFQSGSIALSNALANGIVTNQTILNISNVFDWGNYNIVDQQQIPLMSIQARILYDQNGKNALEWDVSKYGRALYDTNQLQALTWGSPLFGRALYNTSGTPVLNWDGLSVAGSGGLLTNINWNNISNKPALQYGSIVLSNIVGTGALTNANAFQPASAVLSNAAATGILTNSGQFQSGSITLSNSIANIIVTNQSLLNLSNQTLVLQYGSTVLSNIVATGALTNSGMFQSGSVLLSNAVANGIITNNQSGSNIIGGVSLSGGVVYGNGFGVGNIQGTNVVGYVNDANHATVADYAEYVHYVTNLIAHATNADLAANVSGALTNIIVQNGINGSNYIGKVALVGGLVYANGGVLTNLNWNSITNQPIYQYGSIILSNIAGTGALTNANPFQPANAVLSNAVGTGVLTNSSYFQSSSMVLSNSLDSGIVTNNQPLVNVGQLNSLSNIISFSLLSNPTFKEGLMFYDTNEHTLAYYGDRPDVTVNIGQEQHIRGVNRTGQTITNGSVVTIQGAHGASPQFVLAQATTNTTAIGYDAVGVATEDITNNFEGLVTTLGKVHGVPTDSWVEGAALWLSTNAGFMTTNPLPNNYCRVLIGVVIRSTGGPGNNGDIFVMPQQAVHVEDITGIYQFLANASFITNGQFNIAGSNIIGGVTLMSNHIYGDGTYISNVQASVSVSGVLSNTIYQIGAPSNVIGGLVLMSNKVYGDGTYISNVAAVSVSGNLTNIIIQVGAPSNTIGGIVLMSNRVYGSGITLTNISGTNILGQLTNNIIQPSSAVSNFIGGLSVVNSNIYGSSISVVTTNLWVGTNSLGVGTPILSIVSNTAFLGLTNPTNQIATKGDVANSAGGINIATNGFPVATNTTNVTINFLNGSTGIPVTLQVINTSTGAVTYALTGTMPLVLYKTNANYNLTVTSANSTNIISGDNVWIDVQTDGATWYLRY